MTEGYKILFRGGEGEIIEKKSRFIAVARPVKTEEEAAAFVEEMRKKYWDARHHCFAYVLGEKGQASRCSDDGEPSQTAGRPILDVLLGAEVTDACIVVTRYFGGTLLGTGGLVRAYSGAAREALAHSAAVEVRRGRRLRIHTDYSGIGKIQYAAGQLEVPILKEEYTDRVTVEVLAPEDRAERFAAQVTEKTAGRAAIEDQGPVRYGYDGKELIFF